MNHRRKWDAWLATRPAIIRVLGRRLKPWRLYRVKATGQLCVVRSLFTDGTCSVEVQDRVVPSITYGVFGYRPSELEPVKEGRRG